eukprot:Trichotokara_eunicae@DN5906_c0_g2_i2.p1
MLPVKALVPLGNRVILQKLVSQAVTSKGVHLPTSKSDTRQAKVMAVGPGLHSTNGSLIPTMVKVNDIVLINDSSLSNFASLDVGAGDVFLVGEHEILAKVIEEELAKGK